jgi:hypothetical protein
MSGHQYRVGQKVNLSLGIFYPDKAIACTIVRLLPVEGDGLKYRVRGLFETFERVASEHDLSPISVTT